MAVAGEWRQLGEQYRAGALRGGDPRPVDRGIDNRQAAPHEHGQSLGVPSAVRSRVRRTNQVPGQADCSGLLLHCLDQDLRDVDHGGTESCCQRIRRLVQLAAIDAEREERPGGPAFAEPVADMTAGDQVRACGPNDSELPRAGRARVCRRGREPVDALGFVVAKVQASVGDELVEPRPVR